LLPLLAIVALAIILVKGYSCVCNYLSVRAGVDMKGVHDVISTF
jgi:hypothetical protein